MARALFTATGSADAQAFTGKATVVGVTVASGAAATVVYVRDGTTASDPVVAEIKLGAAVSTYQPVPAVDVTTGIFIDRDGTNAAEVTVYIL